MARIHISAAVDGSLLVSHWVPRIAQIIAIRVIWVVTSVATARIIDL